MKRMILAGVLAISLLTLLAACGGESSNNSPSAEDNASAPTAIPPTPQNTGSETTAIEPVLVEHIVSFDSLSFDTAASDRMELMVEEGPPLEHLAEDIGDVSGFIESNAAGIGSIVSFKRGER